MTENTVDEVTQSETIAAPPDIASPSESTDMAGFFIVGAVINIALVAAYIAWAVRQWRKKHR